MQAFAPSDGIKALDSITIWVIALLFVTTADSVAGTFAATGNMWTNRTSHVAVLLNDGHVLVAGGEQVGGVGNLISEAFDPSTGVWSTNGSITTARRFGAAAARMTNGNVLVTGGTDSQPISSVIIFDPVSGSWTNAASMASVRSRHTVTLLQDGRVLVTGGQSRPPDLSVLAKAQIYQSATNAWTNTTSMTTARYFHSAVRLNDGRVLVMGGFDGVTPVLASAEIFNPATGTWTNTGSMNVARYRFPATLLTNGMVLVCGGQTSTTNLASAELYDPITGTWTVTGSMATQRVMFDACLLANGQVLATGGNGSDTTAELYNPNTGTWTSTTTMISGHAFHTSTLLQDGRVLIVGGSNNAEIYDPAGQTWSPVNFTNLQFQPGGGFQFSFANFVGSTNTILKTTNVALPIASWTILTTATETTPGNFQFTDPDATNSPQNFYRVRTP